ncbi:low molecular weight phosphotyrosine protein phosphatase [Billgrantia tianxiuensis]|jgi:protein-tyrosine phosphatase|uniref:protein-tyrosine-phosphatase n=1 Tax=Billgrantia tianxiuensis TaxID=2497861 RepID=A0A6I6SR03_9GAMM|nr:MULTISPECIES: low molecular weight protein-tyrosine-phosphatase [Halomonas]MCE8031641.1 low molecular weight phosphotyrosine protein phosphatase [Halomonas sp. MCCC 1A11057]QHC50220.1 low molecular weight phosphotyrosine protein phosphatase [Halomonas tianxiuensis]
MFQEVLVVCTGNICRSPVGEALLKRALPGHRIASAGLGALVGHSAEPTAARLAEADGLDLSDHRARQIDAGMIRDADLILVMSEGQRLALAERFPFATGKTMCFGRWLPSETGKGVDIPDPYRRNEEVFVRVHRQLTEAARLWQSRLGSPRG